MSGGSQQLRTFRRAIRSGATVEQASETSGIPLAEAHMWAADDAKNPPPPECFEPISPPPHSAAQPKEGDMARTARKSKDDGPEEVKTKDFARAVKLYKSDISPAISKVGEHNQEAGEAYKTIAKQCHIQRSAAKTGFKLAFGTEDAKAEDWMRSFVGIVNEGMGRTVLTFHGGDLVDQAEGKVEPRPKPKLVTLPDHPDDDSDLADGGGSDPKDGSDGDEFEATPEELAKQEGRGRKPKAETIN